MQDQKRELSGWPQRDLGDASRHVHAPLTLDAEGLKRDLVA
jgi:hypothetical protein